MIGGPNNQFYVTGGTLHPDAPSYVERQADRDLYDGLLQGEFCYVLTSRQMGKSSLMVRTAQKLREQKINVIALDLTAIGQNLTPEQWYDGLIASMGRQLRLEEELEQFWRVSQRLSPVQRFFSAIREIVMELRPGPLVIFVDEIDVVRRYDGLIVRMGRQLRRLTGIVLEGAADAWALSAIVCRRVRFDLAQAQATVRGQSGEATH